MQTIQIHLSDIDFTYTIRQAGSDFSVIKQIFENVDYGLQNFRHEPKMRAAYEAICARGKSPLIIDAGANIGSVSLWYHKTYPKAQIVAVEPAPDNCSIFKMNLENIDSITLLEGGIGSRSGTLFINDPGQLEWGYTTHGEKRSNQDIEVPQYAAHDIVAEWEAKGCAPFIFKIDIEGAESFLFSENTEWVTRFPLIVIELHDWLYPDDGTSKNFLKEIAKIKNLAFIHRGENIFCFNNDLINSLAGG